MVKLFVLVVHCASILVIFYILIQQLRKISTSLSLARLGALLKLDNLYSWTSLIMLLTGIVLWLLSEQPPGNLLSNYAFVAKLSFIVVMGCLSVYPSMVFLALKSGPLMTRIPISRWVVGAIFGEACALLAVFIAALLV